MLHRGPRRAGPTALSLLRGGAGSPATSARRRRGRRKRPLRRGWRVAWVFLFAQRVERPDPGPRRAEWGVFVLGVGPRAVGLSARAVGWSAPRAPSGG